MQKDISYHHRLPTSLKLQVVRDPVLSLLTYFRKLSRNLLFFYQYSCRLEEYHLYLLESYFFHCNYIGKLFYVFHKWFFCKPFPHNMFYILIILFLKYNFIFKFISVFLFNIYALDFVILVCRRSSHLGQLKHCDLSDDLGFCFHGNLSSSGRTSLGWSDTLSFHATCYRDF